VREGIEVKGDRLVRVKKKDEIEKTEGK